ncbi:MAG: hypothetical protein Q9208_002399 [Pyrenodesmia sp. 3 TL-2023]
MVVGSADEDETEAGRHLYLLAGQLVSGTPSVRATALTGRALTDMTDSIQFGGCELDVNDISWSAVDLGIWIIVEIGLGIVSGCLPVMRPLFSGAFTSQIRSRFSKYSKSRSTGSHRLPDSNDPSSNSSSKPKHASRININRLDSENIYSGPAHKKQRSWYNNVNAAGRTREDVESGQGSEEEIIPMGKIQVKHDLKHDVEWEQEEHGPKVEDTR